MRGDEGLGAIKLFRSTNWRIIFCCRNWICQSLTSVSLAQWRKPHIVHYALSNDSTSCEIKPMDGEFLPIMVSVFL